METIDNNGLLKKKINYSYSIVNVATSSKSVGCGTVVVPQCPHPTPVSSLLGARVVALLLAEHGH